MKATTTTTTTPTQVRCTKAWGFCAVGDTFNATLTIYNGTKGNVMIDTLPRATMHPTLHTDAQGTPIHTHTGWASFELV